ncbi:MAG: biotin/lipoyl-binding protein [Flavobacteriales bacterium]|nr:biotin/lipoyl-binding protein [Flavobacteriales bacterium]
MGAVKVISENKKEYQVELTDELTGLLNGEAFSWDVKKIHPNTYHIIKNNKSYNLEVLSANYAEKSFYIKVNGNKHKFTVKDRFDELLHSLGMDNLASNKVAELKAPMPGLVLEVSVQGGQQVAKGDALLILEAMKMENVIKSPTDGVIKNISVGKGDTVEKNQLLLNFE